MSIFRFLAYFFSALSLAILISCSNQTPNVNTGSNPAPTQASTSEHSMQGGRKININSAILSELDKLEAKLAIPALSNKIQASRPYGKTEELVSKNVITQAQFDQIKDMVTIEDIQLQGEAKDVDYMIKLGLMKGHMIVAKELLDLQKPDQAEPHIGHPVEEIYADVEDQLGERNVKPFKDDLIALQDDIKAGAKDINKVNAEFNTSVQAIDDAIKALPESQRTSPKFVLQVINGLLDTANSEYTASIADGKIAQVIEYQDSRGFVIYANELFKAISPQLKKNDSSLETTMAQGLADLTKTWGTSPIPPATPVNSSEQVSTMIKAIEQSTQKVAKL